MPQFPAYPSNRAARVISILMTGVLTVTALPSVAQVMAPMPPAISAPKDVAYPGTIRLEVDATDLDRRIFKIHETVPVSKAGDLILMLPKWLPGKHSPGTEQTKLAGLVVSSGGKVLSWRRDPVEVNAFHIDVPAGVKEVTVDFAYLSATEARTGHIFMTQEMLNLEWNFAALYPAGYYVNRIPIDVSLKLPVAWGYATGLETQSRSDANLIQFKPTDFDTLIDSPVYAGRYFKSWDLDPTGPVPVRLNVVADKPEQLAASDEVIGVHKALVQQAYKVFGSYHYNHYDFLLSASDLLGRNGIEHHRSSEDGVDAKYLTDWKTAFVGRDLLAHEYTHSWDGKFRRGSDLYTPDYNIIPMRDSLLWVYEGQTQFWGFVLAARSGLLSKEQTLDSLAITAANLDNLPGRAWRDLSDTTNDPIIANRAPQTWRSYQRSEDYYREGMLIWFDAATLIMEKTGGKASLDDFAKAFFGIKNGDWGTVTYDFDEVVRTLNGIYPYDWAGFLNERLHGHGPGAPLAGFERGGLKLVYTDTPTAFYKATEARLKNTDLSYSVGFAIDAMANLQTVLWEGPAFKAGLAPGAQIIAVNGKAFNVDGLKAAITEAKGKSGPIELIVKVDDNIKAVKVDYHGGLRYPKFEVIRDRPALIDQILTARQ